MITSSVILDIVLAAILALNIYLGVRRGLFRSLMEFASYLVSLFGATLLANQFTPRMMDWMRPVLEEKISTAIGEYLANSVTEAGYSGLFADLLNRLTESGSFDQVAELTTDILLETVLYNLAYVLLFLIAFLILVVLLRIVIRMGDAVMKLPILRQVNTVGGFFIGALKGLLLMLLLLWIAESTGLLVSREAMDASRLAPLLSDLPNHFALK